MKSQVVLAAGIAALLASPALAAQSKPITNNDPDAVDVAKTPVTDLNIDKKEIPAILMQAQARPYSLTGLTRCRPLINEVEALDDILGPDIDLPEEERKRITAGKAGKMVVGSLIPFRGLIREVSGANEHERKVRIAIQAGLARRGFLKGVGQSWGCAYPARPATRKNVAEYMAERAAAEADKKN